MYITDMEMREIHRIEKIFNNAEEPQIISFIKSSKGLKVISCRKFKSNSELPNSRTHKFNQAKESYSPSFFIKNLLNDYASYLDYLYINGIEEVREREIALDIFEILIKALVYCYDVEIRDNEQNMIKIRNKKNDSIIFYSVEHIRPTFGVELLERVRLDLLKRYEGAKNQIGIDEVIKVLRNEPRVSMKVNRDD